MKRTAAQNSGQRHSGFLQSGWGVAREWGACAARCLPHRAGTDEPEPPLRAQGPSWALPSWGPLLVCEKRAPKPDRHSLSMTAPWLVFSTLKLVSVLKITRHLKTCWTPDSHLDSHSVSRCAAGNELGACGGGGSPGYTRPHNPHHTSKPNTKCWVLSLATKKPLLTCGSSPATPRAQAQVGSSRPVSWMGACV